MVLETSVCLHGGLGVILLKAGQVMLSHVFPWQGKLLLGVLSPSQCFPLMQPFEAADEMPAIKGTSYSQFWQHKSSELQVYKSRGDKLKLNFDCCCVLSLLLPPVSASASSDLLGCSCLLGSVSSVLTLASLCSIFAAACTEASRPT